MSDEDFGEERANLHQRIGALETENKNMRLLRTEAGMDEAALDAAREIEDLFVRSQGGRSQRLANIQLVIRRVLQIMLEGKPEWNPGQHLSRLVNRAEAE